MPTDYPKMVAKATEMSAKRDDSLLFAMQNMAMAQAEDILGQALACGYVNCNHIYGSYPFDMTGVNSRRLERDRVAHMKAAGHKQYKLALAKDKRGVMDTTSRRVE